MSYNTVNWIQFTDSGFRNILYYSILINIISYNIMNYDYEVINYS